MFWGNPTQDKTKDFFQCKNLNVSNIYPPGWKVGKEVWGKPAALDDNKPDSIPYVIERFEIYTPKIDNDLPDYSSVSNSSKSKSAATSKELQFMSFTGASATQAQSYLAMCSGDVS